MSEIITPFATAAEAAAGTATRKPIDPAGIRSALNAAGSAPVYSCRAWVNFNGTGTVAIRASANVTSITDNGVGDYTVNFTTAMQDANYSAVTGLDALGTGAGTFANVSNVRDMAAGSVRICTANSASGAPTDMVNICVAVFR